MNTRNNNSLLLATSNTDTALHTLIADTPEFSEPKWEIESAVNVQDQILNFHGNSALASKFRGLGL